MLFIRKLVLVVFDVNLFLLYVLSIYGLYKYSLYWYSKYQLVRYVGQELYETEKQYSNLERLYVNYKMLVQNILCTGHDNHPIKKEKIDTLFWQLFANKTL